MRRALITLLFAGLTLTACGSGVEKEIQAGNDAFGGGEYNAAMAHYQSAATEDPDEAAPLYNMANTSFMMDEIEQAQQTMQTAMLSADEELTQRSHYNLGNMLYRSEQYEGAIEEYKEALRLDPTDHEAKVNLELALNQLQQEQEQQEQEQENQEENQEQQDQENQEEQEQQEQENQEENQEQQDQEEQQENQDQQGQEQEEQDQEGQDEQEEPQEGESQDPGEEEEQDGQEGEQPQDQPQDESQDEQDGQEQDSDQGELEDEEPQDEEPQQPEEGGEPGDEEEQQEPQPGQGQIAQALEGLSEEQARQLLIAASQGTETLQEYLQQVYVFPGDGVEEDW